MAGFGKPYIVLNIANPKTVLKNEAPSKDQKGKTFPTNPKERIVKKLSMYLIDRKNTSSRQKQSHE